MCICTCVCVCVCFVLLKELLIAILIYEQMKRISFQGVERQMNDMRVQNVVRLHFLMADNLLISKYNHSL